MTSQRPPFICSAVFFRWCFVAAIAWLLGSCSSINDPAARRQHSIALAIDKNWRQHIITGDHFDLAAFLPQQVFPHQQLAIYIEGDGLAWVDKRQASLDPTPINPLALQLALQHPLSNAAYLARPCQYVTGQHRHHCEPSVWTSARFSEHVIQATMNAIDILKARHQSRSLQLIGYSGGAAVAALVASRRKDVVQLVTVAGNLDHAAWTTLHQVTALTDSLNPANIRPLLEAIPQHHWVGERDKITPPVLIDGFVRGFTSAEKITINRVPGFDHQCCWVQQWASLMAPP